MSLQQILEAYEQVVELGIALSSDRNREHLIERILHGAKDITNADGGTLYLMTDDDTGLSFEIMLNDTLKTELGGTTGKSIPFPPLQLYHPDDGAPNHNNVATHVAISRQAVNVRDAYETERFDFSGAKAFDKKTGYRSKSFLTVPLLNHLEEVIGVLQLINARSPEGVVKEFEESHIPLISALASQAAVALDNAQLIQGQKDLLEAFIKVIAMAIDAKSPHTSGHCQRVPVLTEMIAEAACDVSAGPFGDFGLDEQQWYELHIAGWMHDCGKVTTPEHVIEKSTKLETIHDRIDMVSTRFEILLRDAEIAMWKSIAQGTPEEGARKLYEESCARINEDRAFLEKCNIGGEFMSDDLVERVEDIGKQTWTFRGEEQPVLTENEIYNLSIRKGTLTDEERQIIMDHIVLTIDMLEQLPFPKHLRRVPEFAGGHHEKMDGTGYPRRLKREDMSVPARMMAISDIFEALTAADRPYKKAMPLSVALGIMGNMMRDQHIDHELFELFVEQKVYLKYAKAFLREEQIDDVDHDRILGRVAA